MESLTSRPANMHGIVRSAIVLSGWTLAAALVLAPFAISQAGSAGPLGLIAAAAICLFSGLAADGATRVVARTSPVGAALIGIMVRMYVPLGVGVGIVAIGQNGRDHLHFICYLLVFYMATLAVETWLAVKRSSGPRSNSPRNN